MTQRGTTEGGRAFLQERLSLFGRWFFIVTFAYYVIANFPLDAILGYPFNWLNEYLGTDELFHLGVTAVAAAVWLGTRGRPRSAAILGALDAIGVILPLALMAAATLLTSVRGEDVGDLVTTLLAATNLIIVRAITVPSTARRTAALSAIGFAPIPGAVVHYMSFVTDLPPRSASNMALGAGLWGIVAVGSATVTSRILFRLRGEVAKVRKLGQYTLEEKIGQGAMGIVYRASHALLRRATAIKLLSPSKSSEADLRRFEREVQLTARLTHPNTIAVYDYGQSPDGLFYYAMEYIEGLSLDELVQGWGPQPAWRVIHVLRQACGALDEAHAAGLIHRDIKPANLMLCVRGGIPDVVKVLDFGLVRPLDTGDGTQSAADAAAGTPLYMSPEAIEAPAEVDGRGDLYALGATAYFVLTGTPVFSGATAVAICSKHLQEVPEPPSRRLGRPLPADLERVLLRCLAKDPASRPRSARELETLLAACEDAALWSPDRVAAWWTDFQVSGRKRPAEAPRPDRITLQAARPR